MQTGLYIRTGASGLLPRDVLFLKMSPGKRNDRDFRVHGWESYRRICHTENEPPEKSVVLLPPCEMYIALQISLLVAIGRVE